MKFRNPKTGEVFDNIEDVRCEFCDEECNGCPLSKSYRDWNTMCTDFCIIEPEKAARMMGYEVITDLSKETQPANSPEKPMEVKRDGGKPRLDLVPLECLIPFAKVREFAARKYGMNGIEAWRDISDDRLFAALLRHLVAAQKGEYDSESGLPAIYHVLCNAAFLAIKEEERK